MNYKKIFGRMNVKNYWQNGQKKHLVIDGYMVDVKKNIKDLIIHFQFTVIILSTLTGAANVGMDSFVAEENKSLASAIVGGVNILAGIVSTLQNFLKVAELMEAHREIYAGVFGVSYKGIFQLNWH